MTDLTPAAATLTAVFSNSTSRPSPDRLTSPTPTVTPLVEHHSENGLSPEAVKMAGWVREDLAAGEISSEQAAKIFDDLGVPLDQRVTLTDTQTEKHRLVDEQFPVGRAQDFRIAYADPGWPAPPMTNELAKFDQSAREWLVGAEFPTDLGNSLITAITKSAQATKGMNDNELESYAYTE